MISQRTAKLTISFAASVSNGARCTLSTSKSCIRQCFKKTQFRPRFFTSGQFGDLDIAKLRQRLEQDRKILDNFMESADQSSPQRMSPEENESRQKELADILSKTKGLQNELLFQQNSKDMDDVFEKVAFYLERKRFDLLCNASYEFPDLPPQIVAHFMIDLMDVLEKNVKKVDPPAHQLLRLMGQIFEQGKSVTDYPSLEDIQSWKSEFSYVLFDDASISHEGSKFANPYVMALKTFFEESDVTSYWFPHIVHDCFGRFYSHAIPTPEALEEIAGLGMKVIDAGAGLGYWSSMLKKYGCDTTAVDVKQEKWWFHEKVHKMDIMNFLRTNETKDSALLYISFPGVNKKGLQDLAGLHYYKGDTLIVVGDLERPELNATFERHSKLYKDWEKVKQVDLPTASFLSNNSLRIYKRI